MVEILLLLVGALIVVCFFNVFFLIKIFYCLKPLNALVEDFGTTSESLYTSIVEDEEDEIEIEDFDEENLNLEEVAKSNLEGIVPILDEEEK